MLPSRDSAQRQTPPPLHAVTSTMQLLQLHSMHTNSSAAGTGAARMPKTVWSPETQGQRHLDNGLARTPLTWHQAWGRLVLQGVEALRQVQQEVTVAAALVLQMHCQSCSLQSVRRLSARAVGSCGKRPCACATCWPK